MGEALKKEVVFAHPILHKITQEVSGIIGVSFGEREKTMVEARLSKRLLELGLGSWQEYDVYFHQHQKAEIERLVSILTTHHTFFFRESSHFEFLEKSLPAIIQKVRARPDRTLRVWSAACSKGHEVYTLAMFLDFHLRMLAPDVKFSILGTDVDPECVKFARNGVYFRDEIKSIPMNYLGNHWAKGTGEIANFVRVKDGLRGHCDFKVSNLMAMGAEVGNDPYDLIFCRNVFIYFKPEQIQVIVANMIRSLQSHGYLFIGVCETLNGLGLPLAMKFSSAYQHTATTQAPTSAPVQAPALVPPLSEVFVMPNPLKVVCVDDSGTILNILKQILKPETGFQVVATAVNGKDAAEKLKTAQAHVMTLDIHMPEMNGVDYLQKHFGKGHPAVVMVTSVPRENAELALKALRSGASDFVEKPALNNIAERADEIRTKLRCAYRNSMAHLMPSLAVDTEFEQKLLVTNPERGLRVVYANLSDHKKLIRMMADLKEIGNQPATVVMIEGSDTALASWVGFIKADCKMPVEMLSPMSNLKRPNIVYFADFHTHYVLMTERASKAITSVLVYGEPSPMACQKLLQMKRRQLLIEDLAGSGLTLLEPFASDVLPDTSFAFHSTECFMKELI